MYFFLFFVVFELCFQALDYFWSSVGDYFKNTSAWKDCPKDIDFWHSIHGIITSIILILTLVIIGRVNLRIIPPGILLKIAVGLQIFSLYWLGLGSEWIYEVIFNNPDCVSIT